MGYNAVADNTGLFFIRLAVVAGQIYEIPRNSPEIHTYSSSRSSILMPIESAYAASYILNLVDFGT